MLDGMFCISSNLGMYQLFDGPSPFSPVKPSLEYSVFVEIELMHDGSNEGEIIISDFICLYMVTEL